jgi:hypothetical protein
MGIAEHAVFGSHVGMPDEKICVPIEKVETEIEGGYLSTMLIRKNAGKVLNRRCAVINAG